jgi:signal recognition particle receptor subunit alpha
MIAACDTFRSGAVEQLKTHCVRLGVPLYERGYEKDPAKVAFEAQRAAERNKKDVLLVDTAGVGVLAPYFGSFHAAWSCAGRLHLE